MYKVFPITNRKAKVVLRISLHIQNKSEIFKYHVHAASLVRDERTLQTAVARDTQYRGMLPRDF